MKTIILGGFLGSGKTSFILKLAHHMIEDLGIKNIVIIENEIGEISVDGGFMQDTGVTVNELISGCICCSLAGDFKRAMRQVVDTYHPETARRAASLQNSQSRQSGRSPYQGM